jgi:hypothetical protein
MKGNRMRTLCLVLLVIPASSVLADDQTTGAPVVFPGDTVQEKSSVVNTTDTITVNLVKVDPKGQPPSQPSMQCPNMAGTILDGGPSTTGFSFGIPPNLPPGEYQITACRQGAMKEDKTTPGAQHLSPSPQYLQVAEKPPTITGISPKALFRDSDKPYYVAFLGPTTLKADANYGLRLKEHDLLACDKDKTDTELDKGRSCFKQEPSVDGDIRFSLHGSKLLSDYSGKQSFSLVHNGAESSFEDFSFVNANKSTPRYFALGLTAALVLLIYLLLSARQKELTKSDRNAYFLTALFLDDETKTYSLSKCQFYAWTLAAVLGYVFLAVARSVVQGIAVFPDIPGGLPAILLFSAGTSVVATGITSSKGSKGAGEVHPTLADFVTSGGVVAPERLQFVVWTVVGIFTFLTIVFRSDVLTLSDLPTIPSGFLQLMGISSAGYLAGKLVRKAGPVLKGLAVANVTAAGGNLPNDYSPPAGIAVSLPVLTLTLKGENLDPKAQIKVDGQALRGDMFWIKAPAPDPQSGLCSELTVSLNAADALIEGKHTLTVVNNDAQAADIVFPIDPMTIDAVNTAADPAVVTGTNFVDPTTARWENAAGAVLGAALNATIDSATKLTVPLPGGAAPPAGSKLALTSSIGLTASKRL